jgi:hypothetical protein
MKISVLHTGMHYVTRISQLMKKQMCGVTCLDALFPESILVPPEQEKYCVNVSRPGRTTANYVTHRSYRMQNTTSA